MFAPSSRNLEIVKKYLKGIKKKLLQLQLEIHFTLNLEIAI